MTDGVNILIVDDTPAKVQALAAILEAPDLRIIAANSGEVALRLLLQHEVAVILLNVSVPGLDGFETAAIIRQRGNNSQTPIIFVTAYDRGETSIAHAYALGAVDFIFAPVVQEVLRAKVVVFVKFFPQDRRGPQAGRTPRTAGAGPDGGARGGQRRLGAESL